MDTAENTALTYQMEKPNQYFSYYNSKEMIEPHEPIPTEPPRDLEDAGGPKIFVTPKTIVLTPKEEFFNTPVNMSVSSVHVPTNVYDRGSNSKFKFQFQLFVPPHQLIYNIFTQLKKKCDCCYCSYTRLQL